MNGANGGNFAFLNSPTNGGDWNAKEDLAAYQLTRNWNDRHVVLFSRQL